MLISPFRVRIVRIRSIPIGNLYITIFDVVSHWCRFAFHRVSVHTQTHTVDTIQIKHISFCALILVCKWTECRFCSRKRKFRIEWNKLMPVSWSERFGYWIILYVWSWNQLTIFRNCKLSATYYHLKSNRMLTEQRKNVLESIRMMFCIWLICIDDTERMNFNNFVRFNHCRPKESSFHVIFV